METILSIMALSLIRESSTYCERPLGLDIFGGRSQEVRLYLATASHSLSYVVAEANERRLYSQAGLRQVNNTYEDWTFAVMFSLN